MQMAFKPHQQRVPKNSLSLYRNLTFDRVSHFGLPVRFVASPGLHRRFKCCPESHSNCAILIISTCLAILAPLQRLLPLPFPAPPLLVIFCAHLTFHHLLSCPISHLPLRFPYAFLNALCPFWHIFCLDTEFECLPLLRLPFWTHSWNCLIL
jgi:hypothetical protein